MNHSSRAIMSIMLIMSCYTGFFNVRRGWQSLNTGSRFYLRLIRRTGGLWIYTSCTTDGRPFKPKKLSIPFLFPGVPAGFVWCLDNWSRILSGKPFSTFSMARLKTLQFHLTLTPFFTATHTLFFFHDLWFGVFGLFPCDPRFMAHIYSPWFVKFSKMANINHS